METTISLTYLYIKIAWWRIVLSIRTPLEEHQKMTSRVHCHLSYIYVADCLVFPLCSVCWAAQVGGSRENSKNTRFVSSRSFKVIEFDTNRTEIYDQLLVINSNFGFILHAFRVKVDTHYPHVHTGIAHPCTRPVLVFDRPIRFLGLPCMVYQNALYD